MSDDEYIGSLLEELHKQLLYFYPNIDCEGILWHEDYGDSGTPVIEIKDAEIEFIEDCSQSLDELIREYNCIQVYGKNSVYIIPPRY